MTFRGLRKILAAAILCLVAVAVASAQQYSGVAGVVTDSSGATVAGVAVQLDNASRGLHFTTTTSDIGVYQFLRVAPAADYELTFTKDGFRKVVVSKVTLGVSTVETRDVKLEVGNLTQSVEVFANGEATLNTTDASIGNTIDTDRLRDLPAQFRNSPAALLALQPGVTPDTAEGETQVGSVTGSRVDQTNITLDGIDVNDNTIGQAFTLVGNAPIDSVQEFRTITTNSDADQGRSSGGQVLLVTKSGSNDWHGSLREYHRNTITAANSFFNNAAGVSKPPLIRNQFGGNLGGKIIKDKLFFFFDYDGLREASSAQSLRTVPLPTLLQGQIGYINNGSGCTINSTAANAPQCITYLTPAQIAQIDPQGIGDSQAILQLLNNRYPAPNTATAGDGINTSGFLFNSAQHTVEDDYVARIDYLISDKHKIFARGNLARSTAGDSANASLQQFPGDPLPFSVLAQRDFTYVVGYTWTISANKVNQFVFGVANQYLNFPVLFEPTAPNYFTFTGFVSDPFQNFSNAQSRKVPVATIKDDFTWTRGRHTWQFGGVFRPMRDNETQITDQNTITLGLGGNTLNFDDSAAQLRPANILTTDPSLGATTFATSDYDSTFAALLGRYGNIGTFFNYTKDGQPLPSLSGTRRKYVFNSYEIYFQDSWRVKPSLTLTYGLRWGYQSVPYEANGLEGIPGVNFDNLFRQRVANAANGVSGLAAEPLISFDLGGKVNNRPGFYSPDYRGFDPRLGIAWSPSFRSGLLGNVFGDRKTSVRLGGAVIHDRIFSTINFLLNQNSFLFDSRANVPFGTPGDAFASLQNDPRFTDFKTLPVTPTAPAITRPDTPFVDSNGIPFGTQLGSVSFLAMDQNFRTPYQYTFSFGVQRQLAHGFIVEADYVGRLGRKLLAQGDFAQTTNFKDPASGRFLRESFGALERQIQAGLPGAQITTQPWFENQMNQAIQQNFGSQGLSNCSDYAQFFFGANIPTCTRLVRGLFRSLLNVGDLSDTVQGLDANGLLPLNVGLSAQVPYNSVLGNFSSSSYNALLVTLKKNMSNGLQFDFDYTYSHSIDNQSSNTRTVGGFGGQVCDLENLHACRGSSDFDARHIVSANFIYQLPFGHGKWIGHDAGRGLDAVIGGWQVSGIVAWHTGFPFTLNTGAFPLGFTNDSAPFVTGPRSALASGIHTDSNGTLQFYKDPQAALAALSNPVDGETGSRNSVNGPGYSDVDLGLLKNFRMPWKESHRLQFRCDMFNAFNHPSFAPPASVLFGPQYGNINSPQFGQIVGTVNSPRVIQFALRYDF
ncbi:MAG TPA: carboxypeptidase-like regulatory domain-containing protein [Candidatus Dormibacteraeota bacterium]|nr:carboxypeptidase-like regulatory domain-containing protein [Candidatus Dormibacteraeota bacterium]